MAFDLLLWGASLLVVILTALILFITRYIAKPRSSHTASSFSLNVFFPSVPSLYNLGDLGPRFLLQNRRPFCGSRPKGAPPNVRVGLPVVGNFIEFGKDQCGFILDMYRKYGPCYSMGMMGQTLTFLVGPDVSEAFFAATDDEPCP